MGASLAKVAVSTCEGLEVAGVDADQLGAQGDGPLGLGLVVHLDQHGQAQLAGLVVEPAQVVVAQCGDDQQGEVGARGSGLEELVALDDEVLAQDGCLDRRPHGSQVLEAATEPALLGQHADRGSPALGVGPGERGGVGDLGEVALAGAAALDLGDHADAGLAEGRHRVARRRHVGERGPQVGLGDLRLPSGQVLADADDDLVENRHANLSGRRSGCEGKPLTRDQDRRQGVRASVRRCAMAVVVAG